MEGWMDEKMGWMTGRWWKYLEMEGLVDPPDGWMDGWMDG